MKTITRNIPYLFIGFAIGELMQKRLWASLISLCLAALILAVKERNR